MLSLTNPIYDRINKAIEYFESNEKISITECAKKFNIHRSTLSKYLKEYDLYKDKRKYKVDENFFEKIDTEEKAYWLGFLTADGCIKKNRYQISLGLSIKDINHLEKYKKSLKSEKNIKIEENYSFNNKSVMCYLRIDNKKMYTDLLNLGFSSKKTMNEQPVELSEDLINHYIRGIFDGDGWISIYGRHAEVGFGMGLKILQYIREKSEQYAKIKRYKINPYKTIFRYKFQSKREILKFLNWIYKDATIYLDRKYEKYLQFCRFELNTTENSK